MATWLADMSAQTRTIEDIENRTVTGQTTGQTHDAVKQSRLAKTHQDYWKPRLRRRTYRGRDGRRFEIPEWQVRMFYLGRESWFNLQTANQAAAAVKARDIYLSLVSAGWDPTLARFKPDPLETADVCTVGEFLDAIEKRSHLRPRTVRIYATKLRKLVSDVAKAEAGMKKKAKRAKYDYFGGGHQEWLDKVNGQSLGVLTADKVAAWRNGYVAHAGADPMKRKSSERSAASILRAGRALFADEVTKVLRVKLPSNPFTGVKLRDPGPQRYHSDINPEWLLGCAERELLAAEGDDRERQSKRQQYLALFLCLCAGLRRLEADLLLWEQLDLEAGQVQVRRTRYFEPKTEESQRVIDLAPEAVDVLRKFKDGVSSEFVLDGENPDTKATYARYRCDRTWRFLNAWLKSKGVRQRTAVHSLRKESGSLIAATFGIEAARHHLGHRDIKTTSAHYVDKKRRVEVSLSPRDAGQLRTVPSET